MNRRFDSSPFTLWDNLGFRYELPDASEPIAFHLAIDGVYEPETLALILQQVKQGDVFVDVGANIGVFTIPAARCVGNNGRVIAAEASSDIFAFLTRNLEANGASQVITVNSAICDFTGTARFYPAPKHKFGMGSLGAQFGAKPIEVPATKLDEVLEEARIGHVDLLKVDVEGFELGVFKGAHGLLTGARPPLVVFEFCDWAEARVPNSRVGDAQRLLLSYGYSIWRLTDFLRGQRPLRVPLESNYAMLVASRQ